MLSRIITAIYDDALSQAGLKVSQFGMLVSISDHGAAKPAELAKMLQMDESTLSRNVERMRAKSLLRLESGPDQRGHLIKLTEKGLALIRKGYPAWQKAQAEASRQLGTDGVAALKLIANKLSG
jgi:DNA-binding MarR family transcriptional regulator